MNFLKSLFGGGKAGDDKRAYYVYVRPKRCDQIVEVRIDLYNDLSRNEEGGYWIRKVAQAIRCPFPAEIVLHFDNKKKMIDSEVTNGELVEKEEFDAWLAEKEGTSTAT